jgi:ATP-dependent RNA helicase RhlE
MTFEELKISRQFLNALDEMGFREPTPVQREVIGPVRGGNDVIAIAQTGTGKTAAYLLPLLQKLSKPEGDFPRCLVLVPSKELVIQVAEVARNLARYTNVRVLALYGGIGPKAQAEAIEAGVDILISTPGRLMEIYHKTVFPIRKIKHLVLDEADRMLDYGFFPQLRAIQELMPGKKQVVLLSATFPERVQRLADDFMLFPTRVEIAASGTTAEGIRQLAYPGDNVRTKLNFLRWFLENENPERVMVFAKSKDIARLIFNELERGKFGTVGVIHSDKGQNARINAMNEFKAGQLRILVCTDVSSRGIDVTDVSHVVNFSVPRQYEDYVHRIGRTGRMDKTGVAITLYDKAELWHLDQIELLTKSPIERLPLPTGIEITPTPKDELLGQLKEIDLRRQKDDPTYQGAFHAKKKKK